MMETRVRTEVLPIVPQTRPALDMDEEQFFGFCRQNRDRRIERTLEGDLEIVSPTGSATSDRNSEPNMRFRSWAKRDGKGSASEPGGATRSPDAARVRRERLADLSAEQERRSLPTCPDFVAGRRSPTDPLPTVEARMREYVENGASPGWLVDPEARSVHVYRQDGQVEVIRDPDRLSGDPVPPGFLLYLRPIWEPGL